MPRPLRLLLAPLTSGATFRRFVHLLLGAVVLLPYLGVTALFVLSVQVGGLDPVGLVAMLVPATAAGVAVTLVPGVRALAVAAARALLDADVPDPDPATAAAWSARGRAASWLVVNMLLGGGVALLTLIVVPVTTAFLLAPWQTFEGLPTGVAAAWTPVVGLVFPVALGHGVAAAGALLARLAPRFLGPSAAERMAGELAAARRSTDDLARRNRMARELHDSVGHALTVTTLQAGAAARVLDTDPEFARAALTAIADTGRAALDELDHVLGVLRAGGDAHEGGVARPAPQPHLGDLDALLAGTRAAGVPVVVEIVGATGDVPAAVSREAYRIVQEALTNALRHAGPVPVTVRVLVGAGELVLEVTNPLRRGGTPGRRSGRGLAGMRERVAALRGELAAGPVHDRWRVAARLPLAPGG